MTRSPASLDFGAKWAGLRAASDLVPLRNALSPAKFKSYLPATAIIEIDPVARTMPIRLAGTALRNLTGFEMTGHNFMDFDKNTQDEAGWALRLAYHDHPVGRYDEILINFDGGLKIDCALTALPIWGRNETRQIFVLVEPRETTAAHMEEQKALLTERPNMTHYIDIGAGIPKHGRDDTR